MRGFEQLCPRQRRRWQHEWGWKGQGRVFWRSPPAWLVPPWCKLRWCSIPFSCITKKRCKISPFRWTEMCTELALQQLWNWKYSYHCIPLLLLYFFLVLHYYAWIMWSLAAEEGLLQKKVFVFTTTMGHQHFDLSSCTKQHWRTNDQLCQWH